MPPRRKYTLYEKAMIRYTLFSRPHRRTVGLDDFATCAHGPLQGELLKVTALQPRDMKVVAQIRPDQGFMVIAHQLLFHIADYLEAIVEIAQTDPVLLRRRN